MFTDNLVFGRENIAYAVLAAYSDAINDKPVVVSMHLGEKLAQSHRLEMQRHSRNVRFFVRKIRIRGKLEIIGEPSSIPPNNLSNKPAPRRIVPINR